MSRHYNALNLSLSSQGLVQGLKRVGKLDAGTRSMQAHGPTEPKSSSEARFKLARRAGSCHRAADETAKSSTDRDRHGGAENLRRPSLVREGDQTKPKHSMQWELMVMKLAEYSKETGSTDVTVGCDARFPGLRQWVQNVRRRRHTLSESRC